MSAPQVEVLSYAERLIEGGLTYGTMVTHEEMHALFFMTMPTPDMPASKYKSARLRYMTNVEEVRDELLVVHKMALASVSGVGYRVVEPSEQTDWALNDMAAEFDRATKRAKLRVENTNLDGLSHEQRAHNADALAKVGRIQHLNRSGALLG